jgi:bifunctional pyridoxal-dependent enzyme with beta-cystathionase and maltose regulon repressor activities
VIVDFPHRPTGALPSGETLDTIAAIAAEVGAHLFSDELPDLPARDRLLPQRFDVRPEVSASSRSSKSRPSRQS